ncbi:hypothetical protein HNR39_001326 [Glaciimonas immobilis]|uniref:Uncharacterized protein n=1 Tax=Glaciimonas immobilis TaxID=728004 RepID=A0A840RSP7_9BURK|nr:hypothetical protein [Glaciimonas immobilis]
MCSGSSFFFLVMSSELCRRIVIDQCTRYLQADAPRGKSTAFVGACTLYVRALMMWLSADSAIAVEIGSLTYCALRRQGLTFNALDIRPKNAQSIVNNSAMS